VRTHKTFKYTASAVAVLAGCGLATSALANQSNLDLSADPANMVMPNVNYAGWNYSELDQINLDNVGDLSLAWTMQLGVLDAFEAPPLVIGDMMYTVSPADATGANIVLALDLTQDGKIVWEFRPDIPELDRTIQAACCGAQTRGMNYADGKLLYQTLDGQVFGLDAETGEALWRSIGADLSIAETLTGNALVVGDLYITGNAGGERGVRGKVQAFNIDTGNLQWVMYNMGPNNEVGIGPRFDPFYADDQGANPALDSWWGDSWRRGGGTVWGYFTYDVDSNMFHYSTGNCGPWNPDYRREWGVVELDEDNGLDTYRNNYCASRLARDATTGELIWAYNMTPQDQWDIDEPLTNPLVDIDIDGDGEDEQTSILAARNGYFYVWDRNTGEILNDPWQFAYVDFMDGVNLETGRPRYNPLDMMFTDVDDREAFLSDYGLTLEDAGAEFTDDQINDPEYAGTEIQWCPWIFARNWHNDAWSPQTELLYTSVIHGCGNLIAQEGEYVAGEGYLLVGFNVMGGQTYYNADGPIDYTGTLEANDPVAGEVAWEVEWPVGNNVPVHATAGCLVFQGGTDEGVMRAFNAETGEIVWTFRTGSEYWQTPVSYIGPDGRQYLAIIASAAAGDGQVNFDDAANDADRYARSGSTLQVFALPRSVAGE